MSKQKEQETDSGTRSRRLVHETNSVYVVIKGIVYPSVEVYKSITKLCIDNGLSVIKMARYFRNDNIFFVPGLFIKRTIVLRRTSRMDIFPSTYPGKEKAQQIDESTDDGQYYKKRKWERRL